MSSASCPIPVHLREEPGFIFSSGRALRAVKGCNRKVTAWTCWLHFCKCNPVCKRPSLLQGYIADSSSTWWSPGHLHLFLQSCFPACCHQGFTWRNTGGDKWRVTISGDIEDLFPFLFQGEDLASKNLRSELACKLVTCCFGSSVALLLCPGKDQRSRSRRATEIRRCNSHWKCLQRQLQMFLMNTSGAWKSCCNKFLGVPQGGGEMKTKIGVFSCPEGNSTGTEESNK